MSTTLVAAIVALIINFIVLVIGLFKIAHLNRSTSNAMNLKYQWQKMVEQITTDQDAWTKKLRELKTKEASLEALICQKVAEKTNADLASLISDVEKERKNYKDALSSLEKKINQALESKLLHTGSSSVEIRERDAVYKNIVDSVCNFLEKNNSVKLVLSEEISGVELNGRKRVANKTFELLFHSKEAVMEWNKNKAGGPGLAWVIWTKVTFSMYSVEEDREGLQNIKEEIKCTQ
jgi:septal ring factor EnvC (AmiA/AmiB activator)